MAFHLLQNLNQFAVTDDWAGSSITGMLPLRHELVGRITIEHRLTGGFVAKHSAYQELFGEGETEHAALGDLWLAIDCLVEMGAWERLSDEALESFETNYAQG
jgi:hypothetical protein